MRRPWLAPLVPLYAAAVALRGFGLKCGWEPVRRLQRPIISIGNLSTGGSGKTPLAIALARLLTAKGISVDVLSRGYGRQSNQAARVRVEGTAEEFGDEPLLIAREAGVPVYVAPQRYDAGLLAEADATADAQGQHDLRPSQIARAHILDDGFQHRQLARDLDILLLNRSDWEDSLLPAGNLREALLAAKRASVLAIPEEDPTLEAELRAWGWTGLVWRVRRRMEVPKMDGPVAAFCGIARPEQFFSGLGTAGLRLAVRKAFRDHHRYTSHDVAALCAQAVSAKATAFITTEKDTVRLAALLSAFPATLPLKAARLRIEIEDETGAVAWLVNRLCSRSASPSL